MTPAEQSLAFVRVAKSGKFTTAEIAERAGLTMDQARDVLFRGCQARPPRLRVNDSDRQNIVIEVLA